MTAKEKQLVRAFVGRVQDEINQIVKSLDLAEKAPIKGEAPAESPVQELVERYVATDDDLPSSLLGSDGPTNPYPTHHEFTVFKAWAQDAANQLKEFGVKYAGQQLTKYILSEANVPKITDVTKVQWESIIAKLGQLNIEQWVAEIGGIV